METDFIFMDTEIPYLETGKKPVSLKQKDLFAAYTRCNQ